MIRPLLRRLRAPAMLAADIRQVRGLWAARRAIARHERRPPPHRAHGLPAPLYVSLTSFPPRFATLHLTLKALLQQTVRPDGVLLWIATADMAKLPPKVRALEGRGLAICPCDDVRQYKKLVFALERYPDAYIVTADDDIYYPSDWLEPFVAGIEGGTILCRNARRIRRDDDGRLAPYNGWKLDVQDAAARSPSIDIFPVGFAGVLYPPRSLSPTVLDRSLFTRLASDNDDLWFYWMARAIGTRHKKVGDRFVEVSWPRSQRISLFARNQHGGNDRHIRDLLAAIGDPATMDIPPAQVREPSATTAPMPVDRPGGDI